jgi:hypothetical protein
LFFSFQRGPHNDSIVETIIFSPYQFVGETKKTFSPCL